MGDLLHDALINIDDEYKRHSNARQVGLTAQDEDALKHGMVGRDFFTYNYGKDTFMKAGLPESLSGLLSSLYTPFLNSEFGRKFINASMGVTDTVASGLTNVPALALGGLGKVSEGAFGGDSIFTDASKKLFDLDAQYKKLSEDISRGVVGTDPTFWDNVFHGAGTSLGFMTLGTGAGALARSLWNVSPLVSNIIGFGVQNLAESLTEAGNAASDAYASDKSRYTDALLSGIYSLGANGITDFFQSLGEGKLETWLNNVLPTTGSFTRQLLTEAFKHLTKEEINELLQEPRQQAVEQAIKNVFKSGDMSLANLGYHLGNETSHIFSEHTDENGNVIPSYWSQVAPETAMSTLLTSLLTFPLGMNSGKKQKRTSFQPTQQQLIDYRNNLIQQRDNVINRINEIHQSYGRDAYSDPVLNDELSNLHSQKSNLDNIINNFWDDRAVVPDPVQDDNLDFFPDRDELNSENTSAPTTHESISTNENLDASVDDDVNSTQNLNPQINTGNDPNQNQFASASSPDSLANEEQESKNYFGSVVDWINHALGFTPSEKQNTSSQNKTTEPVGFFHAQSNGQNIKLSVEPAAFSDKYKNQKQFFGRFFNIKDQNGHIIARYSPYTGNLQMADTNAPLELKQHIQSVISHNLNDYLSKGGFIDENGKLIADGNEKFRHKFRTRLDTSLEGTSIHPNNQRESTPLKDNRSFFQRLKDNKAEKKAFENVKHDIQNKIETMFHSWNDTAHELGSELHHALPKESAEYYSAIYAARLRAAAHAAGMSINDLYKVWNLRFDFELQDTSKNQINRGNIVMNPAGYDDKHNFHPAEKIIKTYDHIQDVVLHDDNGNVIKDENGKPKIKKLLVIDADASTSLHEGAHIFLEDFRELMTLDNLPEQVKYDWSKLIKWLGVADIDLTKDKSQRTQDEQRRWDNAQEKFAVALEQYYMKGKAPNTWLKRIFKAFKSWLSDIYHAVKDIKYMGTDNRVHEIEIPKEIKHVFDNLFKDTSFVPNAANREARLNRAGQSGENETHNQSAKSQNVHETPDHENPIISNVFVTPEPKHIKSATDNNGNFGNNGNIYKQQSIGKQIPTRHNQSFDDREIKRTLDIFKSMLRRADPSNIDFHNLRKNNHGFISDKTAEHYNQQDVTHATGHIILNNKFNFNRIGSGEGGAAFGYGAYFEQSPKVAQHYRRYGLPNFGRGTINILFNDGSVYSAPDQNSWNNSPSETLRDVLNDIQHTALDNNFDFSSIEAVKNFLRGWQKYKNDPSKARILEAISDFYFSPDENSRKNGNIYKASIPDNDVLLNWDALFDDQPEHVKKALKKIIKAAEHLLGDIEEDIGYEECNRLYKNLDNADTGGEIYKAIVNIFQAQLDPQFVSDDSYYEAQKKTSMLFNRFGVPGLRFWDQFTRNEVDSKLNEYKKNDPLANGRKSYSEAKSIDGSVFSLGKESRIEWSGNPDTHIQNALDQLLKFFESYGNSNAPLSEAKNTAQKSLETEISQLQGYIQYSLTSDDDKKYLREKIQSLQDDIRALDSIAEFSYFPAVSPKKYNAYSLFGDYGSRNFVIWNEDMINLLGLTEDSDQDAIEYFNKYKEQHKDGFINPEAVEKLDQIAYHGTGHIILGNKFNLQYVGSGEGGAMFGHGAYFAQNPKVSETYRHEGLQKGYDTCTFTLSNGFSFSIDEGSDDWNKIMNGNYEGLTLPRNISHEDFADAVKVIFYDALENQSAYNFKSAKKRFTQKLKDVIEKGNRYGASSWDRKTADACSGTLKALKLFKDFKIEGIRNGNIYIFDIPENDDLLNWDEKLSNQSSKLAPVIQNIIDEINNNPAYFLARGLALEFEDKSKHPSPKRLETLIKSIFDKAKQAPEFSQNIKGGLFCSILVRISEFNDLERIIGARSALEFALSWLERINDPVNLDWTAEKLYNTIETLMNTTNPDAYVRRGLAKTAQVNTSMYLNSKGILGLRYLDKFSRDDKSGTYNFVIWNLDNVHMLGLTDDSDYDAKDYFNKNRNEQLHAGNEQFNQSAISELRTENEHSIEEADPSELLLNPRGLKNRKLLFSRSEPFDTSPATGEVLQTSSNNAGENDSHALLKSNIVSLNSEYQNINDSNSESYNQSFAEADSFYLSPEAKAQVEAVRNQYQGTEQWLKAPNGRTSNLSESQWLAVRTPNFKRWFGDWENDPEHSSKILDANGEPLVVYHGTNEVFSTFNRSKKGWLGPGIYFTPYLSYANDYLRGKNGVIMPLFMNLRNPLRLSSTNPVLELLSILYGNQALAIFDERYSKIRSIEAKKFADKLEHNKLNNNKVDADLDRIVKRYIITQDELQKILDNGQHDGIAWHDDDEIHDIMINPDFHGLIDYNTEYSVQHSNQVKSATRNNGNFSEQGDVYKQIIGIGGAKRLDQAEGVTWRTDNLKIARKMDRAKSDSKTIWAATGWIRGVDKKWRMEIPDGKIIRGKLDELRKFNAELTDLYRKLDDPNYDWSDDEQERLNELEVYDVQLHNFFDAPQLFDAYPDARKINIEFADLDDGLIAQYDPNFDGIAINNKVNNARELRISLIHEIQHAIQFYEGFANGANFSLDDDVAYKKANQKLERALSSLPKASADKVRKLLRAGDNSDLISQLSPDEFNAYRDARNAWDTLKSRYNTLYSRYERHAGETEARNTQTRAYWGDKRRQNTPLDMSEDVPRDQQIVGKIYKKNAQDAISEKYNQLNFYLPFNPNELKTESGNSFENALSSELILTPHGSSALAYIDIQTAQKAGIQEGQIQANVGVLRHAEIHHGSQIKNAGYPDVKTFLLDVLNNWSDIREGSNHSLWLIAPKDEGHGAIAAVRLLQNENGIYRVATLLFARNRAINSKRLIFSGRPAPDPSFSSGSNLTLAASFSSESSAAKGGLSQDQSLSESLSATNLNVNNRNSDSYNQSELNEPNDDATHNNFISPRQIERFNQLMWHGTRHTLEGNKFDLRFLSSGQGGQSYGYGIYLAQNKAVASSYRKAGISSDDIIFKDRKGNELSAVDVRDNIDTYVNISLLFGLQPKLDANALVNEIKALLNASKSEFRSLRHDIIKKYADNIIHELSKKIHPSRVDIIRKSLFNTLGAYVPVEISKIEPTNGNLYSVDGPEDFELLDWNVPMSKQSTQVLDALKKSGLYLNDDETGAQLYRRLQKQFGGGDEGERLAAMALNDAGIPGHRFWDAWSRISESGTHNFVIWNTDTLRLLGISDDSNQDAQEYYRAEDFNNAYLDSLDNDSDIVDYSNADYDADLTHLDEFADNAANDRLEAMDIAPDSMPYFQVHIFSPDQLEQFNQMAYHGTGHIILGNKFNLKFVGTGEGNQAYGYGAYLSEITDVAEHYRHYGLHDESDIPLDLRVTLNDGSSYSWKDVDFNPELSKIRGVMWSLIQYFDEHPHSTNKQALDETRHGYNSIIQRRAHRKQDQDFVRRMQEELEVLDTIKDIHTLRHQGNIYLFDIPDDHELLDWDAPLDQQPEAVKLAIKKIFNSLHGLGYSNEQIRNLSMYAGKLNSGEDLYNAVTFVMQDWLRKHPNPIDGITRPDARASMLFNKFGIPGLRYFDQFSRDEGKGTHNFVIWDNSKMKMLGLSDDSDKEAKDYFNKHKKPEINPDTLNFDDVPDNFVSDDLVELYNQGSWHGTKHIIENNEFDLSKVGSGEGGAMFGYGIYSAQAIEVADSYRTGGSGLIRSISTKDGKTFSPNSYRGDWSHIRDDVLRKAFQSITDTFDPYYSTDDNINAAKEALLDERADLQSEIPFPDEDDFSFPGEYEDEHEYEDEELWNKIALVNDAIVVLDSIDKIIPNKQGNLYFNDVPEDWEVLDWDKKLKQQSPHVSNLLRKAVKNFDQLRMTGGEFYHWLSDKLGSKKKASMWLLKQGIPGLRYWDKFSRDRKSGTHNFVTWDTSRIKILDIDPSSDQDAIDYFNKYRAQHQDGFINREAVEHFDQLRTHATGHIILNNHFNLKFVGSGEGGAAFGHGIYFEESLKVAQHYRRYGLKNGGAGDIHITTKNGTTFNSNDYHVWDNSPSDTVLDVLTALEDNIRRESWDGTKPNFSRIKRELSKSLKSHLDYLLARIKQGELALPTLHEGTEEFNDLKYTIELVQSAIDLLKDKIKFLRSIKSFELDPDKNGNIYIADIPDDYELLDWDAPLNEQPEHVKKALDKVIRYAEFLLDDIKNKIGDSVYQRLSNGINNAKNGGYLYQTISAIFYNQLNPQADNLSRSFDIISYNEAQENTSELFNRFGIPGHRYFDQFSRDEGKGTHNFVIWNMDKIKIVGIDPSSDQEAIDYFNAHNNNSESYNQIIGEMGAIAIDEANGNTNLMDNLQVAHDMTNTGKDAKTIKLATGWELGHDSKWKYEIPDEMMPVFSFFENLEKKIREIKEDESSLYRRYHILESVIPKKITSKFSDEEKNKFRELRKKREQLWSDYISAGREIMRLNNLLQESSMPISDLLGDNNNVLNAYSSLKNLTVEFTGHMRKETFGEYSPVQNLIRINSALKTEIKASALIHELQHAIQHFEGFAIGTNADNGNLEQYKRSTGEVEARNAQSRWHMSEEQRKNSTLEETEDIPRSEQITHFDNETYNQVITKRGTRTRAIDTPPLFMSSRFQIAMVRNKFEGTDKWMKAPNGKDTNLNEHQWLTVRTPNFKRWFGDWENDPENASKVLDENGEPLVVAHISRSGGKGYSIFNTNGDFSLDGGKTTGTGAWFADFKGNEEVSAAATGHSINIEGKEIYHVFLNLRNPLIYDAEGKRWQRVGKVWITDSKRGRNIYHNKAGKPFSNRGWANGYIREHLHADYDRYSVHNTDFQTSDELVRAVRNGSVGEGNHDGVIIRNLRDMSVWGVDDFIAFSPEQIKSAVYNNGNFNGNDPDIYHQIANKSSVQSGNIDRPEYSFLTDEAKKQVDALRAMYEDTDKWMKAPNGKNTNLSELQWLLVRTQNFKNWFGDWENDPKNSSKAVDENGEPLVVYHGSNTEGISVFYTKGNQATKNAGSFFSSSKPVAKSYILGKVSDDKLYPVFLNVRNPYTLDDGHSLYWSTLYEYHVFDNFRNRNILVKKDGSNFSSRDDAENYIKSVLHDPNHKRFVVRESPYPMTTNDIARFVWAIRKNGKKRFDAVIFKNIYDIGTPLINGDSPISDVFAIPQPEQIKSANKNNGNFDPLDADHYHQVDVPDDIAYLDPEAQFKAVKKLYRNSPQWMKAPNWQDSQLTQKQWIWVRTPAFKEWFGDWENDPENASKVLDANGEPLIVYHRTKRGNNFYIFDIGSQGAHFGTREQADDRGNGRLYPVFLNIRNLQRTSDQGVNWNYQVKYAKKNDIDGLVYLNEFEGNKDDDSWVVFYPEQIKSATKNSGEFSSSNPDIYHQTDNDNPFVSRYAFSNHDTENLFSKAQFSSQRDNHPKGLKHSLLTALRGLNGDFPELATAQAKYKGLTYAREILRMLKRSTDAQTTMAVHSLTRSLDNLNKKQFEIFTRLLLINDIYAFKRHNPNAALPLGFSPETLKNERVRFSKLAQNDPEVLNAIQSEHSLNSQIRNQLVTLANDLGLKKLAERIKNNHFDSAMIDYANIISHNSHDINANYIHAMGELRIQQLQDIERLKAIKELKDKYDIKDKLIKRFGEDWRINIPNGFKTWSILSRNFIQSAQSLHDNILSSALDLTAKQLGLSDDTLQFIRASLDENDDSQILVLRSEIVNSIDAMLRDKDRGPISQFLKKITTGWKQYVLFFPTRAAKYNIRNITGDLDAVLAGNPKAVRFTKQAISELYTAFYGDDNDITPELLEFQKRGGALTAESAQELKDYRKMKEFKNLLSKIDEKNSDSWKSIPYKFWEFADTFLWSGIQKASNFREGWLRYACYLDYLEQMQSNEDGRPDNFGASDPDEVMSIPDIRDRAFKMSNELLGAYDQVSETGQALRDLFWPFYSWVEVNAKRYIQLIKNGISSDNPKDFIANIIKSTGIKSPIYAYRIGKTLLMVNLLALLIKAFNHLVWPDDEDKLPPDVQERPHITLGHDPITGDVLYFDRVGALTDNLEWFAGDSFASDIKAIFDGKLSVTDWILKVCAAPLNKIVQGITPLIKTPFELATGKALYPDFTNPRNINDKLRYLAQSFGLSWPYKAVTGEPYSNWDEFKNLFVYSSDADEAAYFYTLGLVRQFKENVLGKRSGGFSTTRRSIALQNLKKALRVDDKDAVKRYLNEYYDLGGNNKGIKTSMRNMNPLHSLSKKEQQQFLRWISEDDRKYLQRANKYFQTMINRLYK